MFKTKWEPFITFHFYYIHFSQIRENDMFKVQAPCVKDNLCNVITKCIFRSFSIAFAGACKQHYTGSVCNAGD